MCLHLIKIHLVRVFSKINAASGLYGAGWKIDGLWVILINNMQEGFGKALRINSLQESDIIKWLNFQESILSVFLFDYQNITLEKIGMPCSMYFGLSAVVWQARLAVVYPSNAKATLVQYTRMQIFGKTISTLSSWYSLDSSCWVLSDEYPYARVSVIFQDFCTILLWPNKLPAA